ncbi:hypothetical protein [Verrucosispora sp. TAA-831]|uniref:hypothetical protein n=1 Tax=Verrucosispora sp. TAA-831 TaxID=3422227 RepID=UPI003D6E4E17
MPFLAPHMPFFPQLGRVFTARHQTASQQPAALFNWRIGALLGSVVALERQR